MRRVMKAFIYNWESISRNRALIRAHALDDQGKYTSIIIDDFKPFCFVESTEGDGDLMRCSLDISEERPYKMIEFDTYDDMDEFVGEHGRWRVYMNDISPIPAFLGSRDYPPTGWFEVRGQPRGQTLIPLREDVTPTYPMVACFDIECKCSTGQGMPKSYRRQDVITMISVVFHRYLGDIKDSKKYLLYVPEPGGGMVGHIEGCEVMPFDNEYDMIEGFAEVIRDHDPDVITGYNIFGFDFDYILSRLKLILRPLPDFSRSAGTTRTYKVDWTSNAYGDNYYNRIESSGRVFIDMMLYFRRQRLDSYSLDFVSKKYLGRGKLDVDHHGPLKGDHDVTEYGKYCINDSVLTLELFDKFYMWTDVCEMSRAMRCSIEDIYTRGEQMKVVNQAIWSCLKRGIVLKPRQAQEVAEYQGGYVLEPAKGVCEGCSIVDFQSMYPSILIAYNICPSTYVGSGHFSQDVHRIPGTRHSFRKEPQGILPKMVESLLSERKAVKKRLASEDMDPMTRVILNTRQNALKVCANSVYGITGSKNSKYFSSVGCAESTTGMGRRILKSVIRFIGREYVEDVDVVYGDTDSCMLRHNGKDKENNIELAKRICADVTEGLPKPMALNFEDYYDKILFMSKKRYIMYKEGKIQYKGVANARRNYCPFVRKLFGEIVERVLDPERGSAEDHLSQSLFKLLASQVPSEQLIMSKSIKSLESYKAINLPQVIMMRRLLSQGVVLESGSRIEYIFTKQASGLTREQAKLQGYKMYTPEEVVESEMEVDYAYYIEKQVMPVVEDIFGNDSFARQLVRMMKSRDKEFK
jgi:DNA polymerase delta subunit 1